MANKIAAVHFDLSKPINSYKALPPSDVATLRTIKRRADLNLSPVFQTHQQAIEDLTYGITYGHPSRRAEQPARRFLRAVAWNIERGKQLDGIKAYMTHHPHIAAADVIILTEVDLGMARSGNRDVAAEIAHALGFEWVFGNSYLCLSAGNSTDGAPSVENHLGLHGNAILSRFPIVNVDNFSIAITKDKFHSSEKRLGHKKALVADLETPLGRLSVCGVHLDSGASCAQRQAQLMDVLHQIAGRPRVLLGGDFNTTTYDANNLWSLLWNIARKLFRGGFPHAMHHYVHPYKLYERGIFKALQDHGFFYEAFNAMGVGTIRYEVDALMSESKVRDYLPEIAVKILRWKLRPWNGVAPLKLDWFAGRGVHALLADERQEESQNRQSLAPTTLAKPVWKDQLLSDHDPIIVDIAF